MVRTYAGHKMSVKDVTFNNDGTEFLSASFDRYIKLWDTETGGFYSFAFVKSFSIIIIVYVSIVFKIFDPA